MGTELPAFPRNSTSSDLPCFYNRQSVWTARTFSAISTSVMAAPISGCFPIFFRLLKLGQADFSVLYISKTQFWSEAVPSAFKCSRLVSSFIFMT